MSYISQSPIATFTWAGKPASYPTGIPVFISNVGTKGSWWAFDGTRWKPFGRQLLMSLDTAVSGVGSASTSIVVTSTFPAALFQVGDTIHIDFSEARSGSVDIGRWTTYIGTAATTADARVIDDIAYLSSTLLAGGMSHDIRIAAATSVQVLASPVTGYGPAQTTAAPAAATITNVSSALAISLGVRSSGSANTVTASDAKVWLQGPAN